ncbi:gustatory and odorant receptor 22-like [Condylostylus longicornis]|uniref:gustatory and odorant receptor 22-like n=1 Tax=Condylostylus longicornis TaxID=2530218 RepID=UPI00244DAF42|nr:gustatory and odorant receptor 22-like [Condylostylus longicornis]
MSRRESYIEDEDFDQALNYSVFRKDLYKIFDAHRNKELIIGELESEMSTFARESERLERQQLKSTHGPTAEIYDQFYRDHKLLLKLFQLLGVMPIIREPGAVAFRWISWPMIYAVIVYSIATVIVILVGRARANILLQTSKFDEYIYAVIFLIFLVPHFWIPFVGWGVAGEVARYKTMWGTFQVRYYRVTGTTLTFPNLAILIGVMFIGCVFIAILFLVSLQNLLDGFLLWHTSAYYHIIIMINMNACLWYINSTAIRISATSLSNQFQTDIHIECNASMISQYRYLWLNLSELLQSLGNAYARTYSTYSIFMFVNITISTYGALSGFLDHGIELKDVGLLVIALYCSILLYVFADCSHKATEVVARGIQDTLCSVDLHKVDLQTQKEIDLFIVAIRMNPAVVDLKGFGNVNRELLTSSLGIISIYLLVLLQFKLSLQKGI